MDQIQDRTLNILKPSDSNTQLIIFPFVGGFSNSFMALANAFDMDIEIIGINPPGHGPNRGKLLDNIDDMAELYIEKLSGHLKQNVIFLGYSLGALVAHNMIGKLTRNNKKVPQKLIISAAKPPHFLEKKSHLNDTEFVEFLKTLGGLPEIVEKDQELLMYFLPIIRNDYNAVENCPVTTETLDTPVHLIFGTNDTFVTYEKMKEWKRYFSSKLKFYNIEGDHMFVKQKPEELAVIIEEIIEARN